MDAVRDGAANEGDVVEDDGRLVGVLEEDLAEDVDEDGEGDEGGESDGDELPGRGGLYVWPSDGGDVLEEAHGGLYGRWWWRCWWGSKRR